MSKIKVHPNDPTIYMFWDVALDMPNAFYVRDQHPSWSWNGDYECPTVSPSIRLIHTGNQVDHLFIRDGKILIDTKISSIQRGKDQAKEVKKGFECGITLEKYDDFKEGDTFEVYVMEQVKHA